MCVFDCVCVCKRERESPLLVLLVWVDSWSKTGVLVSNKPWHVKHVTSTATQQHVKCFIDSRPRPEGKEKKRVKKNLLLTQFTQAINHKRYFTRDGRNIIVVKWAKQMCGGKFLAVAAGITSGEFGSGNKGAQMHCVFGSVCLPHCVSLHGTTSPPVLNLHVCASARIHVSYRTY